MARETLPFREGNVDWFDGRQLRPFDLRREFLDMRINVRVTGQVLLTSAAVKTVNAEGLRGLFTNIRMVGTKAGSPLTPKDYSGIMCWRTAHLLNGAKPELFPTTGAGAPLDTGGAIVNGSYPFRVTFPLEFLAPYIQDPLADMFGLDSWRFAQLRLLLTTTSLADLIIASTVGDELTDPTGVSGTHPFVELIADVATDVEQDTALVSLYQETERVIDVGTANGNQTNGADFNINSFTARLVQRSFGEDAAGLRTNRDTIIERFELETSRQTHYDSLWTVGQQKTKTELSLEEMPAGYNIPNWVPQGNPDTGIDTRGHAAKGARLQGHVDTNGNQAADTTSTLLVLQQEMLPAA